MEVRGINVGPQPKAEIFVLAFVSGFFMKYNQLPTQRKPGAVSASVRRL